MTEEVFRCYRRRLPHFRIADATYFVTWRVERSKPDLTPSERTCVADAIRFFDLIRYELTAWVVMNDHVHVVVTPLGDSQLEQLMHTWRGYTTKCAMARRTGRPCVAG